MHFVIWAATAVCLRLKFVFIPTQACAIHHPLEVGPSLRASLRHMQRCPSRRLARARLDPRSAIARKGVPTIHDRVYRDYSLTPSVMRSSDLARRGRGRKMISAQGEVYDLDRMFAKLNRRYFDGEIPKPTITRSQRRTKSILGHHDHIYDSITISKTLDSTDVPEWFVEYILYHEMLHIKHPARLISKDDALIHTSAFRLDERRFPHYEQAQKWLERLARLRRAPEHVPRERLLRRSNQDRSYWNYWV